MVSNLGYDKKIEEEADSWQQHTLFRQVTYTQ